MFFFTGERRIFIQSNNLSSEQRKELSKLARMKNLPLISS